MLQRERRHRRTSNFWLNSAQIVMFIAWLVSIFMLLAFHFARPELDYGILRYFDIETRDYWLWPATSWFVLLYGLCLLLTLVVVVLNHSRQRRQTDHPAYSVWILWLLMLVLYFSF